jgi:hypothetical protein
MPIEIAIITALVESLAYSQNYEHVTIEHSGSISSSTSDGVVEPFSVGTLVNKGKIVSTFNRGVLWSGLTNDIITNAANGSIVGFDIGVQMSGQDDQVLNNYGKII